MSPRSVTIKLDYPVPWGDKGEITEITLSRIKAKHLKGISMGRLEDMAMDDIIPMLAQMSNQPDPLIGELDMTDINKLVAAMGSFLGSGGPSAGSPSSSSSPGSPSTSPPAN